MAKISKISEATTARRHTGSEPTPKVSVSVHQTKRTGKLRRTAESCRFCRTVDSAEPRKPPAAAEAARRHAERTVHPSKLLHLGRTSRPRNSWKFRKRRRHDAAPAVDRHRNFRLRSNRRTRTGKLRRNCRVPPEPPNRQEPPDTPTAPNPPIPPQRRWRIFAEPPITPEPSPVPPDSGSVCRFSENPAKRSCRFRSFCGFCRTPPIPPNCRFRQTADSVDSADFAEPSPVSLVPPVLPIPPILPIPAVPPNPPISRKFDAENRRPPIRPIL